VIGNGDIQSPQDVAQRRSLGVAGVMLGRAAMSAPWVFAQIQEFLKTGELIEEPPLEDRWKHIVRHCRDGAKRIGNETIAMQCMRSRLMAYSRGFPEAKYLRSLFSGIASLGELEDIAGAHIVRNAQLAEPVVEDVGVALA